MIRILVFSPVIGDISSDSSFKFVVFNVGPTDGHDAVLVLQGIHVVQCDICACRFYETPPATSNIPVCRNV